MSSARDRSCDACYVGLDFRYWDGPARAPAPQANKAGEGHPRTRSVTMTMSLMGQSLPSRSDPAPIYVRCWSNRRQVFAAQRNDAKCHERRLHWATAPNNSDHRWDCRSHGPMKKLSAKMPPSMDRSSQRSAAAGMPARARRRSPLLLRSTTLDRRWSLGPSPC